eukprot:350301-Chlamydomonas_euryale.AAC.2
MLASVCGACRTQQQCAGFIPRTVWRSAEGCQAERAGGAGKRLTRSFHTHTHTSSCRHMLIA